MTSLFPLLSAAATEAPLIDIDGTALVQFAIFIAMYFALKHLIFLPYLKLRALRQAELSGKKEAAEALHAEAQKLTAESNKAVLRERAVLEAERVALYGEVQQQNQTLLEKTRQTTQTQLDSARAEIEGAVEKATASIHSQAEPLGHAMASTVLGREV